LLREAFPACVCNALRARRALDGQNSDGRRGVKGTAWDNYDAIGLWRTLEKFPAGAVEAPLINPAGLMPDGRPFKDASDFKRLLIEGRDKFVRAFIEHLCTYGLRRVLTFDDQGHQGCRGRNEEKPIRGQGHRPSRGPVQAHAQTLRLFCSEVLTSRQNLGRFLFKSPNVT